MKKNEKRNPSSSLERQIAFYPNHKHYALIVATAFDEGDSKSTTADRISRAYFNNLPCSEKERLMQIFEDMPANCKKRPYNPNKEEY